jgi:hypothetical protein
LPPRDFAALADSYVADVLDGIIPACKWVRLACARHRNDLWRAENDPSWNFEYNAAMGARVCRFAEMLPHVKGEWARADTSGYSPRIRLEPWQCFLLCSLFGWVRKDTGKRRFRQASIYLARKNGKSSLAAIIGLWMFAKDEEPGAEVYSGATSRDQANEVFKPAQNMAKKCPDLLAAGGITVQASGLFRLRELAKLTAVIGKPGDGASPHCAIVDEYHEHGTSDLHDTMQTGMAARSQPLLLIISTAGSNLAGPCRDDWRACEAMLTAADERGQRIGSAVVVDDSRFALIYTADEADDWTDESIWVKANPNLGVSVPVDFIRQQVNGALAQPRNQGAVKTKHLNLWVTAMSGYFDVQAFNAPPVSSESLRIEDFSGKPCFVGVDAAAKRDISAIIQLFPWKDGDVSHYTAFGRYYLPRATVDLPQNQHYRAWEAAGWLTVCDGNENDFGLHEREVVEDAKRFAIQEVCFDPWQLRATVGRWRTEHGLPCIEIPRTTKSFSDTMKELDAAIASGRFHHRADPVLAWAMSNVVAKEDAGGNVFPRKEAEAQKIDPAIALLMAFNRALAMPEQNLAPSVFFV